MRWMIILFTAFPFLMIFVALLRPDLVFGSSEINASFVWSLAGTLISYLGFVASSFALHEVTRLNRRYFAKQRLPEIRKSLEKITKSMPSFASQDLQTFRSQPVLAEVSVMIRQIKVTKVASMADLIKSAEEHTSALEAKLSESDSLGNLLNHTNEYWDLYHVLSKLSQEIGEYEKSARASL